MIIVNCAPGSRLTPQQPHCTDPRVQGPVDEEVRVPPGPHAYDAMLLTCLGVLTPVVRSLACPARPLAGRAAGPRPSLAPGAADAAKTAPSDSPARPRVHFDVPGPEYVVTAATRHVNGGMTREALDQYLAAVVASWPRPPPPPRPSVRWARARAWTLCSGRRSRPWHRARGLYRAEPPLASLLAQLRGR